MASREEALRIAQRRFELGATSELIPRQVNYLINLDGSVSDEEKAAEAQTMAAIAKVRALTEADAKDPTPILGLPPAYWLDLHAYQHLAQARALGKPILLLQGEADYQVTMNEDFQIWQHRLRDLPHYAGKSYPGLSHQFMPAGTPPGPDDYHKAGHVDAAVIALGLRRVWAAPLRARGRLIGIVYADSAAADIDDRPFAPELLDALSRHPIAGVTLFRSHNAPGPRETRALTDALQAAAAAAGRSPLLIGADQEGGQLMAIPGTTPFPGNLALAATGSDELAHATGRALGRELAAMGVNVNYAPVCDVNINPQNPVIGTRSFGEDPATVSRMAAAMIAGMQSAGVAACAKHFPGHGDTASDSHDGLVTVPHSRARLDQVELPPFAAAIAADVRLIMTAHVALPALTGGQAIPSTLAPQVLRGLLRGAMGFGGVIISDAMDMRAIGAGPVQPWIGFGLVTLPRSIWATLSAESTAITPGLFRAASVSTERSRPGAAPAARSATTPGRKGAPASTN